MSENKPLFDTGYRDFYNQKEAAHWEKLQSLMENSALSFPELVKNYPAFIRRRELPRLLAHYELFKMIEHLPGSIVELGVYIGAGLFTFGNLLETFVPGDRSRKVYGFDSFEGYTNFTTADGKSKEWIEKTGIKEKKAHFDLVNGLVELHNNDNLVPGVERVRVIKGDILKTVPEFAAQTLGLRLSMLYFDVNMYEPTKCGLDHLYDLVLPGGIVAFNAYGAPPWEGEARAIEEFFKKRGEPVPPVKKFPFSTHPSAYIVKK